MKKRDIATAFPNYVSQHLLLDVWNVLTWTFGNVLEQF